MIENKSTFLKFSNVELRVDELTWKYTVLTAPFLSLIIPASPAESGSSIRSADSQPLGPIPELLGHDNPPIYMAFDPCFF